ncbi:MAG: hypothetical protein ACFNT5_00790 [Cardiobacterium hominis]|uniref:hypothetical protein n=1 Tax=uncultured Cardiobacterium sp. TaxID=417619 RepID=UPI0026090485|nr:hypothetical protein [uncultured Cardiobacterium sp.]
MSMQLNIENAISFGKKGELKWVLEELVRNLKELKKRTDKGDMAAIDEFFDIFVFNEEKS